MNYRKAAITAGASVAALLIMGAAAFLCFIATFGWSLFGGGLGSEEKLLWLTLLPATAGVGGALVARSFGAGTWRVAAAAGGACVFAAVWAAAGPADIILSETTSDSGRLSVQSVLLWTSALCVVIVTVRRPEVPTQRAAAVYLLSAVSAIGGLLLADINFGGPSLLASFVVWILLPALAGLLVPPLSGVAHSLPRRPGSVTP